MKPYISSLILGLALVAASSAHAQIPVGMCLFDTGFAIKVLPCPCGIANSKGAQCSVLTTDSHYLAFQKISTIPRTMPWQGNTPATVEAQFPVVINWEFQTETAAALNAQMALMGDMGLARFSQHYWIASKGQLDTLMLWASLKLTAPNLLRFRAAFGAAALDTHVNASAPATVKAAYWAGVASHPTIKLSHAAHIAMNRLGTATMSGLSGGVAAPSTNMTLYEIYTEYLFTSAETEMGAFAKMAAYAGGHLGKAFAIGYKIGHDYYGFASSINPDYGYTLVTEYGNLVTDYQGDLSEVTGTGEVDWANVIQWDSGGVNESTWSDVPQDPQP